MSINEVKGQEVGKIGTGPVTQEWRILRRVAEGEGEAFESIVSLYQDRVMAVCYRMLGSRAEAEDAAQEAFLKLYRKASQFKRGGKVFTLLYRIAVNHCLNKLRRRKIVQMVPFVRTRTSDSEDYEFDPVDEAPDPATVLMHRERWGWTKEAIEALPPAQKAVVVLTKFEGLSYKEAAKALNSTVSSVESRLFRAMRKLEISTQSRKDSPG